MQTDPLEEQWGLKKKKRGRKNKAVGVRRNLKWGEFTF